MNSHAECRHVPLGIGAVFCCRTRLIYVKPELIPTEQGRKNRGDACDIFARRVRQYSRLIRGVQCNGAVLMAERLPLPHGKNDFKHLVDWLREEAAHT